MKFYTRIFFRIIRCVDSITFLAIIIYHYFNRFRANNFLKKKKTNCKESSKFSNNLKFLRANISLSVRANWRGEMAYWQGRKKLLQKKEEGSKGREVAGRSSLARAAPPFFFRIVFAGIRRRLMRNASPRRSWRRGLWMGRRRRRRRRSTYEGKRTSREKSVWPRAPTITVDRRSHVVLLAPAGRSFESLVPTNQQFLRNHRNPCFSLYFARDMIKLQKDWIVSYSVRWNCQKFDSTNLYEF